MNSPERLLLSGNKAVALAARNLGIALGTGYPGTPSTEILEEFSEFGGRAQWAPNEKVALEVGLSAAYGGARALVTMKHVGLNVAADPLFTAAYTGVSGANIKVAQELARHATPTLTLGRYAHVQLVPRATGIATGLPIGAREDPPRAGQAARPSRGL